MSYLIYPEQEGAWSHRGNFNQVASQSSDNRYFIPPFVLGTTFTSRFIAIGIKVEASRSNWKYGGYLGQEVNFTSEGYTVDDKAHYRTDNLLLNTINIVELPLISASPYTLRFFPPNWFFDCQVQIWEYVGEVIQDCASGSEPNIDLDEIQIKLDLLLNLVANLAGISVPVLPSQRTFTAVSDDQNLIFAYYQGLL